jgi:hypothetical protein
LIRLIFLFLAFEVRLQAPALFFERFQAASGAALGAVERNRNQDNARNQTQEAQAEQDNDQQFWDSE